MRIGLDRWWYRLLLALICIRVLSLLIVFTRPGDEKVDKPNILLIMVDALRPDHLHCYGYPRDTSPNIDRLAENGVRFSQAISTAPYTAASVPSIMTSAYPRSLGTIYQPCLLKEENITLAEILRANGYYNGAVVANGVASSKWGFDQGFHDFYDLEGDATAVTDLAVKWLRENKNRRFFLWLFYLDVHFPYDSSKWLEEEFDPDYTGNFTLFEDWEAGKIKREQVFWHSKLAERDLQHAIALYDASLAYTDSQIGRLLAELRRLKLDETLIILTADHGESLGEHGLYFAHSFNLYDPLVRVPLIFSLPSTVPSNKIVSQQVSTLDIMPTVLGIAGVKTSQDIKSRMKGENLRPAILGGAQVVGRIAYAESAPIHPQFYDEWPPRYYFSGSEGSWKMARTNEWKLICIPETEQNAIYELYNLEEDPGETKNLAHREKKVADTLKERLENWLAGMPRNIRLETGLLDAETKEKLRALGYLQ